jgi:hypothetical protein
VRVREHGLSANATITKVDGKLSIFPRDPPTDGTRRSPCPSPTHRAVWSTLRTQTTPAQVGRRRSDDPDRLRPGKADLDQPHRTG